MKLISRFALDRLSPLKLFLSLLLTLGTASTGHAQTLLATAQISDIDLGGGIFDYTITLNNTGTGPIGTFWFAWIPGQDYLAAKPTNITSPSGWTSAITGSNNGTDGNAIQWIASTPLASGSSLNFSFDSTDAPAAIAGNSIFHSDPPVGTSFVYGGAPFSDAGYQFVVQSVPEPSALGLLVVGALGFSWMGWRRSTSASVPSLS